MGGCYCSFKLKLSLSQEVVFLRYVSHHVTVGTSSRLNNPERTCWLPHTSSLPIKVKNPVLQPRWTKPLQVDRVFRAEPYSSTGTSKHDEHTHKGREDPALGPTLSLIVFITSLRLGDRTQGLVHARQALSHSHPIVHTMGAATGTWENMLKSGKGTSNCWWQSCMSSSSYGEGTSYPSQLFPTWLMPSVASCLINCS